ncbi:endo alpha-1,4 polygalactosaminidase [Treponema pedis]|uniref:endo alpha-1,4 polygalactosaminidase n=1 Tax=Treponema pedis TaxID=409322 RepID=UPI0003FA9C86|nr:endo alpha-1,4 polygalactosaminidase [Treponema pedis]
MKNLKTIIFISIIFTGGLSCENAAFFKPVNYRSEMRRFVKEISQYAKTGKKRFYIVPQNGQELAETVTENNVYIETDYIESIDAVGREDLFYGYTGDNKKTPAFITDSLTRLCNIFKTRKKPVFVTDYCLSHKNADLSYLKNNKMGYISFAANGRALNTVPEYPDAPYNKNNSDITKIEEVKNFLYLINGENYKTKEEFISALEKTDFDLLIIDLFHNEEQFTKREIEKLKLKKSGGKRLVLCYLSIGEAEDYRYYWNPLWKKNKPVWLKNENPDWKGNYKVAYWNKEWKKIIYGASGSYLDKILDSNFDGVYLDIIDAFEYFENNEENR